MTIADWLNSVNDPDIEIDVEVLRDNLAKAGIEDVNLEDRTSDPFMGLEVNALDTNSKRRIKRLQKRSSTETKSGAKSKALEVEALSAYDVLKVVTPPFDLNQLAKLYETNSAHNAAVTAKAVNICGLGYEWLETKAILAELADMKDKERDARIKELNEERIKLDNKLSSLNDDEEFNEIMTKVWMDVEALGNGYLEIGRNVNGGIGYFGHIPGFGVRVRASRDGFIQIVGNKYVYFRNFDDKETPNPLGNDDNPNELIHFKKYSPNSTYYGVPDIIPALPSVLGDRYAREYNIDYFENKAVPRYAFIVKGAKLGVQAEQNLINYFNNQLKGKHHGTLYIPIPAGFNQQVDAKFEKLEVGIQEGSFIGYLEENRQEILMVHRVPPGKVGVFLNMNLAIARDADRTFREQVCRPEQRRVEKKIKKLFDSFTKSFVFKFIETDVIDADIKSRVDDRYLRTQVLTPNDVLRSLGKPTRKDGNKPLPYGPQQTNQGVKGAAGRPPGVSSGNEGRPKGSDSRSKTSDTTHPQTRSPADQTGTRRVKGQAQEAGDAKQTGSKKETT